MARPPKTLSKDEIKTKKAGLKEASKIAAVAFAAAKSDNDAAAKSLAKAQKEAGKLIAAAQKTADVAAKKFAKAEEAYAKGKDRIKEQLAALEPAA